MPDFVPLVEKLFSALNSITDQGLAAMLALGMLAAPVAVVYLIVSKRGLRGIKDNHLAHMEISLKEIAKTQEVIAQAVTKQADSAERQERLLTDISGGINFLKGKVD